MPILSEKIIEAKDIRDRITLILDSINVKISMIGSNAFFCNGSLDSDISSVVNRPNQTSAFIDQFNILSSNFRSLSSVFNVKRGEIIYLKGFYEYIISCFAAASDIRWTVYNIIDENKNSILKEIVSYLNDSPESTPFTNTPLLSSSIEYYDLLSDGRYRSTDFRFNHSENNQTILSSIEKYSSYDFSQLSSFDTDLSDIVNYNDLNDTQKWMYITQTISADHANGMFNLLNKLNIAVGKILSCEYWWVSGLDYPSVKPRIYSVRYFKNTNSTTSETPVRKDTAYEFLKYRIKTWTEATRQAGSINEWVNIDNVSKTYVPNSNIDVPGNNFTNNNVLNLRPQITKYDFLIQAWNMDDQNFEENTRKSTRYFQFNNLSNKISGNADVVKGITHYVNFYKLINSGKLSVNIIGNTTCKISGFTAGFNWMKFDSVKLWVNEIYHTHPWKVYIVDHNLNDKKRLLLDYNGPTWQTKELSDIDLSDQSRYINGGKSDGPFGAIIFSSFTVDGSNTVNYNSNTRSNHKVGLRISTDTNGNRFSSFSILSEFGADVGGFGDEIGSRELFFYPVSLKQTGKKYGEGFKGITLFN